MRRLRRGIRDESGLTLIELLVAMTLLTILLAVVANLYVSAMRTVGLSRELTANTKQVANAMNETTRAIRAATENPVSGSIVNAPRSSRPNRTTSSSTRMSTCTPTSRAPSSPS